MVFQRVQHGGVKNRRFFNILRPREVPTNRKTNKNKCFFNIFNMEASKTIVFFNILSPKAPKTKGFSMVLGSGRPRRPGRGRAQRPGQAGGQRRPAKASLGRTSQAKPGQTDPPGRSRRRQCGVNGRMDGPNQGRERWEWRCGNVGEGGLQRRWGGALGFVRSGSRERERRVLV